MKQIPLSQGKFALVDDEDYDFLMQWKWYFDGRYAARVEKKQKNKIRTSKTIYMHKEILNVPGFQTDHKNTNQLDNTRANLRKSTHSQNQKNKPLSKTNTSGYKGVSWRKIEKKWKGQITFNNKTICLGLFDTPKEAAIAYNKAAYDLHGEFAFLNPV